MLVYVNSACSVIFIEIGSKIKKLPVREILVVYIFRPVSDPS